MSRYLSTGPPHHPMQTCAICQASLLGDLPVVTCDSCNAVYHQQCWEANGGCGTYGCRRAPEARKLAILEQGEAGGTWGDNKNCPNCGELLAASAMKCTKCKAVFDTRAPMTPQEYAEQEDRKRQARQVTWMAVLLFVGSALGFLAPLTLPVGLAWLIQRRHELKKAAGAAELLHYGALAVSTAYIVLLAAVFVWRL